MIENLEEYEKLEPKEAFSYFGEISNIPHGSGNLDGIAAYIVDIARTHGLQCIRDDYNNVIVFKNATPGYEKKDVVILQSHIDMVCAKTEASSIDFLKDSIAMYVEGDYIKARNTSLGADDGIGVAIMLAVLTSETLAHPGIEAIFTADEETGMIGAAKIDVSMLAGKQLINLDSEQEGVFVVSCAGGIAMELHSALTQQECNGVVCTVTVDGLQGGHSGVEINKGRGNANNILGRILLRLLEQFDLQLVELDGGQMFNGISKFAQCKFCLDVADVSMVQTAIVAFEKELQEEFGDLDPMLTVSALIGEEAITCAITLEDTKRLLSFLAVLPQNVQNMGYVIKDFVKTSLNLGVVKLDTEGFSGGLLLRSSSTSELMWLAKQIEILAAAFGIDVDKGEVQLPWELKPNSTVVKCLVEQYEKLCPGKKAEVIAIHAGVECGQFTSKLQGLDGVSMGPNLYDVHTVDERLHISSVEILWKLLLHYLEQA